MAPHSVERITKGFLQQKSGDFDIESIIILDLSKFGIKELGSIEECKNLEFLNLSHNKINSLIPLGCLVHLTYLNLSNNHIVSLEGLQILENLETLNLAGNHIESIDTLYSISGLYKLKHLIFQSPNKEQANPICSKLNYKSQVLSFFSNLRSLDRESLHGIGSEVCQMFQELDWRLNAISGRKVLYKKPAEPIQIPSNFWSVQNNEEDSVEDAERNFKELLNSCRLLLDKSEKQVDPVHQIKKLE